MTHLSEFRFGQSLPESFVFSQDGRYLYGSAYYTGVSNIYRYEVATGEVEAVSNAESGFFRPVPLADGRLVVLTYTAAGVRSGDD
jgi:Tol biopolymer transport system component